MNNKTKLTILILALASSPTHAETDHDICSAVSHLASSMMKARHKGLSMAESYEKVELQMYKNMVMMAYSEPLYTSAEYIGRSVTEFSNKIYMACINGGVNELKRQIDAQRAPQPQPTEAVKNVAYTTSLGNGTTAVISSAVCKDPEFLVDGYVFAIDSGIAQSKLKRASDAYYTHKGVAYTEQGCWKAVPNYKDDSMALAKFRRKSDGKISYREIDFKNGSWSKL